MHVGLSRELTQQNNFVWGIFFDIFPPLTHAYLVSFTYIPHWFLRVINVFPVTGINKESVFCWNPCLCVVFSVVIIFYHCWILLPSFVSFLLFCHSVKLYLPRYEVPVFITFPCSLKLSLFSSVPAMFVINSLDCNSLHCSPALLRQLTGPLCALLLVWCLSLTFSVHWL